MAYEYDNHINTKYLRITYRQVLNFNQYIAYKFNIYDDRLFLNLKVGLEERLFIGQKVICIMSSNAQPDYYNIDQYPNYQLGALLQGGLHANFLEDKLTIFVDGGVSFFGIKSIGKEKKKGVPTPLHSGYTSPRFQIGIKYNLIFNKKKEITDDEWR